MNRTIKVVGCALGITGLAVLAARAWRSYLVGASGRWFNIGTDDDRTPLLYSLREAVPTDDRQPSRSEFSLMQMVAQYGWPIWDKNLHIGTDPNEGPYLLFPIGSRVARLHLLPGDESQFYILSWGDTPVTGPLGEPNPTHRAALQEFNHL